MRRVGLAVRGAFMRGSRGGRGTAFRRGLLVACFAVVLLALGGGSAQAATTCSDFNTQPEAQAALPSNPQLDRDNDNIACEDLPGGTSSSTSNSSSPSVVTQADCDAGRITRNGRTLSRAECERLIGQ